MADTIYRYWSNGTEGELWHADNCRRCAKDHRGEHTGEYLDGGCPVILATLTVDDHRTIEGLIEQRAPDRGWGPDEVRCVYFTPCGECGVDPEYRPWSWSPEARARGAR